MGQRTWHSITSIAHIVPQWKLTALADKYGMVDTLRFDPPLSDPDAEAFTREAEKIYGPDSVVYLINPQQWVFRRA